MYELVIVRRIGELIDTILADLRLHTEMQNLDLRDIGWLTGNEQHNAEAVGEVGIAGEIASWPASRRCRVV